MQSHTAFTWTGSCVTSSQVHLISSSATFNKSHVTNYAQAEHVKKKSGLSIGGIERGKNFGITNINPDKQHKFCSGSSHHGIYKKYQKQQ